MSDAVLDRAACEALDATDPLRELRALYDLPRDLIYLDGNSLGPLPHATAACIERGVRESWGHDLIRSWNTAGWIDLPRRVGDAIASLIGADAGEVVAADSTSVNLFKVLSGAIAMRPEASTILSERGNFPTDLYIAQGLIAQTGGTRALRLVDRTELLDAIDADTAVVMLTQVDYRSGSRLDLAELTARAHAHGALIVWDLAHSAGAFEVALNEARADFAVGCGYKYLNGGPGAPAFVFVAQRHQRDFAQPLSGWMGHAAPFDFDAAYRPAEGISRALVGTPPILSMLALECGVDAMRAADAAGRDGCDPQEVARAQRPVHRTARAPLRGLRTDARDAARARLARQSGEFRDRRRRDRLRGDPGADRALGDRRLPRARRAAFRIRAELPAFRRRLGRGRAGFARCSKPARGIAPSSEPALR